MEYRRIHTKYTKQQQLWGQMHLSEADITTGLATRHLLKYRCDGDHVRFVYGSVDISFILKLKKDRYCSYDFNGGAFA